jgi:hypothetical protein
MMTNTYMYMCIYIYIFIFVMKTFNRKFGRGCPRATRFLPSRVTFK